MTFQDALAARLAIMNVSRSSLEGFLRDHPPLITPGMFRAERALPQAAPQCCSVAASCAA